MKPPTVVSAVLLAQGLSACAHAAPIEREQAIDLGVTACRQTWGKVVPDWEARYPVREWEARQVGDHWRVWFGVDFSPVFSIEVPSDGGRLKRDACLILIED